jgi:hypothetical protein
LYSPAFIIEVMRPSMRTLVSGTNIIIVFLLYCLFMVWCSYAMLFSSDFLTRIQRALAFSREPVRAPYKPPAPVIWFNDCKDR